jgi:hypothetical protein
MLIADELIMELMRVDGELLTAVEQPKTQVTGMTCRYAHIRITHTYQKFMLPSEATVKQASLR